MAPTWRTEAGRSPGRDSGTRLCLRKPCRPLSALTLRMGTEVGEAGAAREGADPVTDDGVKTGRDAAQRNLTRPSKSEISPFATTRMGPESIYHAERDSKTTTFSSSTIRESSDEASVIRRGHLMCRRI